MNDELIFVGYRSFTSKSNKECNVLDFITKPKTSENGDFAFSSNVAIFTTKDKYDKFISNNELLDIVSVNFEIVAGKVRYII